MKERAAAGRVVAKSRKSCTGDSREKSTRYNRYRLAEPEKVLLDWIYLSRQEGLPTPREARKAPGEVVLMDLSKLKMEAYDLLAVILPGLILIFQAWITIRGWAPFAISIASMSGSAFLVLILMFLPWAKLFRSQGISRLRRSKARFFRQTRDKLGASKTGEHIRERIRTDTGHELENVAVTFDFLPQPCATDIYKTRPVPGKL